ncbi:protein Wnt-3a-like isoform X1 [Styela clava]
MPICIPRYTASMSPNREVCQRYHVTFVLTYWVILFLCIAMFVDCGRRGTPRWWNVVQLLPPQTRNRTLSGPVQSTLSCSKIPGLVPRQLRFCRNYKELMQSIAEGTKFGINECKYQFKGRRWNCSTITLNSAKVFKRKSIFGSVLETASREAAFVHAITTAGIAYAVTKACSAGRLSLCGCNPTTQNLPVELERQLENRNWRWGGCNDHIDYGIKISQDFVDAQVRVTSARSLMNKHNNEAGRQAIKNNMWVKCKCHGLSGSCDLQTCWWSTPSFRRVGNILKEKYDAASEMVMETHKEVTGRVEVLNPKFSSFQPPGSGDLIYYQSSLDYCEPNRRRGILGTKNRRCNATSAGIEGCDLLCCERGYESKTIVRKERCNCVFHWCCHVTCKECMNEYEEHTCK